MIAKHVWAINEEGLLDCVVQVNYEFDIKLPEQEYALVPSKDVQRWSDEALKSDTVSYGWVLIGENDRKYIARTEETKGNQFSPEERKILVEDKTRQPKIQPKKTGLKRWR